MEELTIVWTDYMLYRIELRGFDIAVIERIVRYSEERYFDAFTERLVAIGRHHHDLVMIPYERDEKALTPVTIHITNRQQIEKRVMQGRLRYE